MKFSQTQGLIIVKCDWLTEERSGKVDSPAKTMRVLPSKLPLAEWKQSGKIFGVRIKSLDYFPQYQFDSNGMPLPVIEKVLRALGPIENAWAIAAWFVFPNGWIERPPGITESGIAPMTVLNQENVLIAAAVRREGTYVA